MSTPLILYDNIFTTGTPTATDTDSGSAYDAANINDYRTYTTWKAASSGTKYLYIDAGASDTADTLGVISHNMNTVGATVSVEYSATGAWAGEEVEALAGFAPTDDKAILKTFNSASGQYWRVKLLNTLAAAEIGVVFLGERMDMPERVKARFVPELIKIVSDTQKSKAGNILGSVVLHKPYTIKAEWNGLTYSFVNTTYRTFWEDHASELKPFFWAHDIGTFPAEIKYVTVPQNARLERPLLFNDRVESLVLTMEGKHE